MIRQLIASILYDEKNGAKSMICFSTRNNPISVYKSVTCQLKIPEQNEIHGFLGQVVVLIQISLHDAPQVVDIQYLFILFLVKLGCLKMNKVYICMHGQQYTAGSLVSGVFRAESERWIYTVLPLSPPPQLSGHKFLMTPRRTCYFLTW